MFMVMSLAIVRAFSGAVRRGRVVGAIGRRRPAAGRRPGRRTVPNHNSRAADRNPHPARPVVKQLEKKRLSRPARAASMTPERHGCRAVPTTTAVGRPSLSHSWRSTMRKLFPLLAVAVLSGVSLAIAAEVKTITGDGQSAPSAP